MSTFSPRKSDISRTWHLLDANGQVLGRLATEVSALLSGKRKRSFAPHVDGGDHVVVVNAEKIRITGTNKPQQKIDFRHSGYPGGVTMTPYDRFMKTHPTRVIELAVAGMLPKNRLRAKRLGRLKVYRGDTHPHAAQFPPKKELVGAEKGDAS